MASRIRKLECILRRRSAVGARTPPRPTRPLTFGGMELPAPASPRQASPAPPAAGRTRSPSASGGGRGVNRAGRKVFPLPSARLSLVAAASARPRTCCTLGRRGWGWRRLERAAPTDHERSAALGQAVLAQLALPRELEVEHPLAVKLKVLRGAVAVDARDGGAEGGQALRAGQAGLARRTGGLDAAPGRQPAPRTASKAPAW